MDRDERQDVFEGYCSRSLFLCVSAPALLSFVLSTNEPHVKTICDAVRDWLALAGKLHGGTAFISSLVPFAQGADRQAIWGVSN